MNLGDIVGLHLYKRSLETIAVDPDHIHRVETEGFRDTKTRLHTDGHYHCWVCNTTEEIEIHHRAEWMFSNIADWQAVKEFCEEWDPYGYGRLLRKKPVETLDDPRVALALCRTHHREKGTGIHELDFSLWIMQKLALPGAIPIPQQEETVEEAVQRVTKYERKVI